MLKSQVCSHLPFENFSCIAHAHFEDWQTTAPSTMDDNGRVNGKVPVFNDLLTFMWCKTKICARDTQIDVISSFYQRSDVVEARDLLYSAFPVEEGQSRRRKHQKSKDDLIAMYNLMQELPTENPPVFASLDINNLPCV